MAINVELNELLLTIGSQHVQIQALERRNAALEQELQATRAPQSTVTATGSTARHINGVDAGVLAGSGE